MKRKYFSALLMGAMAIASMGVVSCSDYDDDISSLSQRIDSLEKLLADIQSQISAGSILTSVESDGNGGVTLTLSNGKTYNIAKGEKGDTGATGATGAQGEKGDTGAAGQNADIWTIGEDGYWYKNKEKTDYYAIGTQGATGATGAQGEKGDKGDKGDTGDTGATGATGAQGEKGETGAAGQNGKDGKYYVPNAETGTFWVYNDGEKAPYNSGVSYISATVVTAIWTNESLTLNNVDGATDGKVVINLTTALKSLVFNPQFYYEGIEAMDLATFQYKPMTISNVNADGDYSKDAPTVDTKLFTYAPDLAATYFLNPSNAKMSADASKYEFVAFSRKYVSRASLSDNFQVESADLSDAGKVTVHAKYNGDEIKNLSKDNDDVTVVALQYTAGDTTVTSDFAAIRSSKYTDLALNFAKASSNSHKVGDSHLYTTAAQAIAADASWNVAWNDTVDLRTLVNTDRTYESVCKGWDKNAANGVVEKDGFKYSFQLVGYMSGTNKTSQSAHAAIAADGYTLRPQMTKDGKQQAYGAEQNEATIDREPLVRVVLTDTVNNKVAAVGYLKLKITSTGEASGQLEVDMSEATDAYTLACSGNALQQKLTWDNIEEQIIAQLNMSKTDFETKYELAGGETDANQYPDTNASSNALAATTKVGVVSQTTVDIEGTQTEVLQWTITAQEAYNAFKAGKTELTTYVRYQLKGTQSAANKYVYVKFTWKPSAINIAPATTFGEKIEKSWYAMNSTEGGSGKDAIQGNVEVVGQTYTEKDGHLTTKADCEYVFNIKNTLVGNDVNISMAAPYNKLSATPKFYFQTWGKLYANPTGDKVYAEATLTNLVASLDQTTGIVTFADNEVAKKLLNAAAPTDVDNTLTAKVAVKATVCDNIDIKVNDNTFYVRFLRPITASDATATFDDTETGGSTASIKMTFKDWRGHSFTDKNVTKDYDYFDYYGVSEIKVDIDNATTDLNGNSANLLKDVNPNVHFTFTPAAGTTISSGKYGELTYNNNGTTVGTYHVFFDVYVTYKWGTVKTKLTATIKGSSVSAAKKN